MCPSGHAYSMSDPRLLLLLVIVVFSCFSGLPHVDGSAIDRMEREIKKKEVLIKRNEYLLVKIRLLARNLETKKVQ